ncbi:MAG: hypothetical protein GX325_09565 [Peptococcaceae bacterium]|nr:hypothetical protein [Peptococcaceae bacterium]
MKWTRYKFSVLLWALLVAWGVSHSVSVFNNEVCPETPLCVFKWEDCGYSAYQVEFLGEKISFTLPLQKVTEFFDSEQIIRYRQQVALTMDKIGQLMEALIREASLMWPR